MLVFVAGWFWSVSVLITVGSGETVPTEAGTFPPPEDTEHGHADIHSPCGPYYKLQIPTQGSFQGDQQNKAGNAELPICEPVCGKPDSPVKQVQRIIGGFLAANNSFPWQVKMLTRHNRTVGATLISDQWLLTTGLNLYLNHTAGARPEEIAPTLRLFLANGKSAGPVAHIVLHPDFPREVDLALLRLQNKVSIGATVMPICLPKEDYVKVGRVGFVSGWGRNIFLAHPDRMRYVQLPVANSKDCAAYYAARGSHDVKPLLGTRTFCVGMSVLRENTCYGDAGGAFVVEDPQDNTWYAAGIHSFDKTCSSTKYGVYVRLFSVVDWIKKTMAAAVAELHPPSPPTSMSPSVN